jgi:hypothetical protein
MPTNTNSGPCRLCGKTFGKAAMTRHLTSCWQKHMAAPSKPAAKHSWFHLIIEGRFNRDYWLHLQASAKESFGSLDSVLRRIWLECCGHLSAFEFPVKRRFPRGAPFDLAGLMHVMAAVAAEDGGMEDEDAIFGATLGSRLTKGVLFTYEYDFGSTTKLSLRVAGQYPSPVMKGAIKVLARNDPPEVPCSVCKRPATQICSECIYDGSGDFCDACAEKHECGEEMLLPIVNSPRAGVCAYSGPSVEP